MGTNYKTNPMPEKEPVKVHYLGVDYLIPYTLYKSCYDEVKKVTIKTLEKYEKKSIQKEQTQG